MIGIERHTYASAWQGLTARIGRARCNSLLRNSIFLMGTTIITSLLGYIYWIAAARSYSAYSVGLASALIAAMTLTSNLSNLGLASALVQLLPRSSSARVRSLTLTTAVVAGVTAGLLAGVGVVSVLPHLSVQFLELEQRSAYAIMFVGGVAIWTVATLMDAVFIAVRSGGTLLLRNVLFAATKIVLLIVPALFVRTDAIAILASWVLASVLAVVAGAVLIRRLEDAYRPVVRGIGAQWRSMRASLAGHHLINIGGTAPMYLLPTFVTMRLSPVDNAYFYTTWMIGSLFFMISPAVAASLFAEGAHSTQGLRQKIYMSAGIIGGLLVPTMAVFLLGGSWLLRIFGADYASHGTTLLTILVCSAVPDAITSVYVSVLRIREQLRAASVLTIGMAVIALVMAWVLLPELGIAGAGWGWLIAQSVGSVGVALHVAWERRGAWLRGKGFSELV